MIFVFPPMRMKQKATNNEARRWHHATTLQGSVGKISRSEHEVDKAEPEVDVWTQERRFPH